jgi:cytochrome c-type biogenesis protein CcmE
MPWRRPSARPSNQLSVGLAAKMRMKTKVLLAAAVMIAVIGYLVFLGASSPWQYYLFVDECYTQQNQWQGKMLRVNGRVTDGSLRISPDRRSATFALEGKTHKIAVACAGPLPDNLAEGIEVVVEGKLQPDGGLQGERVITRCASKYAPKNSSEGTQ